MNALRDTIHVVRENDLKLETISTYYEHAHIFGDEFMLSCIMTKLHHNISDVEPSDPIVTMLHTEEWMQVLDMVRYLYKFYDSGKSVSKHVSELVVEFLAANQGDLELASFYELTYLDRIPFFSHKVVLRLLSIEKELAEDNTATDLSCLQKRCAHIYIYIYIYIFYSMFVRVPVVSQ